MEWVKGVLLDVERSMTTLRHLDPGHADRWNRVRDAAQAAADVLEDARQSMFVQGAIIREQEERLLLVQEFGVAVDAALSVHLRMGSDPEVVWDDARIEQAAAKAVGLTTAAQAWTVVAQ
jgi:hypothetical protein